MRSLCHVIAVIACAACAGRMPYKGTAREWLPAEFNRSVTHVRASADEEQPPFAVPSAWSSVKWCQAQLVSDGRATVRFDRVTARLDQDGRIWIEATGENGIIYSNSYAPRPNEFRKAGEQPSAATIPQWARVTNPTTVMTSVPRPTLLITTDSDSSAAKIAKGFQELIAECGAKKIN